MRTSPLPRLAGFVSALVLLMSIAGAEPVEDFTLDPVGAGEPFTLSKARGKYVALHFLLKTECPVCLRHTQEHFHRAKDRDDLVQVFIKPDEEADIAKWLAKVPGDQEGDTPVIHRDPDAQLAKEMSIPDGYQFHGEVVHYPATVVINPAGEEIDRYVGRSNRERLSYAALCEIIEKNAAGGSTEIPGKAPASRPATQPATRSSSSATQPSPARSSP